MPKAPGVYAPDGSLYITLTDGAGNTVASPVTGQVAGTATNDNATAGNVGEYLETVVGSGSAVALTAATPANIATRALTAGDWDVWGIVNFVGNAATTVQYGRGSLSLTSAIGDDPTGGTFYAGGGTYFASVDGIGFSVSIVPKRISIASGQTVYLVARAAFGVNTCSAYGGIYARRRR